MIFLSAGIRVEHLDLGVIKAEKLYLKLDKKLIATAEKLEIPPQESSDDPLLLIRRHLTNFWLILDYFDTIEINALLYGETTASLLFREPFFEISTQMLSLRTQVSQTDDLLDFTIQELVLHEQQVEVSGALRIDLENRTHQFSGRFALQKQIAGALSSRGDLEQFHFTLDTEPFVSLESLRDLLPLPDTVSPWVFDNVRGRTLQLSRLEGTLNLLDPEQSNLDSLTGELVLTDGTIFFKKGAKRANFRKLRVEMLDGGLLFKLDSPGYLGKTLQNSYVYINNLYQGRPRIDIFLTSRAPLDADILEVLAAYDIHLPLLQTEGAIDSSVVIQVMLDTYDTEAWGHFASEHAKLSLSDFNFSTSHAEVILHNSDLRIESSRVIAGDFLDTNLSLDLNTSLRQAQGTADIYRINVRHLDHMILDLQRFHTPLAIHYGEQTVLSLPEMETDVGLGETFTFHTADLAHYYPHSPFLQNYGVKEGELAFQTRDFRDISLKGILKQLKLPLRQSGTPLTQLDLKAELGEQSLSLSDKEGTIRATVGDTIAMNFQGIDLVLDDLENNSSDSQSKPLVVTGLFSNLIYDNRTLSADRYTITKEGNFSRLALHYGEGSLMITGDKTKTTATGENLDHVFLNRFLGREAVENGRFDINATIQQGKTQGVLSIRDAMLTELKTLNNLMAFIDSVPSLLLFRSPGFSEEGYKIEKGEIDFTHQEGNLTINSLALQGDSMDIHGTGWVDLDQETMHIDLLLRTFKGLSSIIDTIPVVGYIIVGESGRVSTGLTIEGSLENPTVKSHLLGDTLNTPFSLFRRLIKAPFQIFDKEEKKEEGETTETR